QRAFERRAPLVEGGPGRHDLDRLQERRVELEARLSGIERGSEAVALGTREQQALWRRVTAMEADLERLGEDRVANELRDKQRFLKGLLMWEVERDYKERLWEQRSALRRLDLELKQAEARRYGVEAARSAWPGQLDGFAARAAALEQRLDILRAAAHAA